MTNVAKYNITKGISTVLTMGTPIITMFCCGDFFVKDTGTAISSLGVLTLLFVLLFTKDKIAENWKAPSTMIVAGIIFVFTTMIKNIITPIQIVAGFTFLAGALDEATVKSLYKRYELLLPTNAKVHKHFGFIFSTLSKLQEESKEINNATTN